MGDTETEIVKKDAGSPKSMVDEFEERGTVVTKDSQESDNLPQYEEEEEEEEDEFELQLRKEASEKSHAQTTSFHLDDIVNDPNLHKAALAELYDTRHTTDENSRTSTSSYEAGLQSSDLSKQRATLMDADEAAREESVVNAEYVQLIRERLNESESMLTQLFTFLEAIVAAENAYTEALQPVMMLDIKSQSDGQLMKNASQKLLKFPAQLLQSHQNIQVRLEELQLQIKKLQYEYKGVIKELTKESQNIHKNVYSVRRNLYATLQLHEQVTSQATRVVARVGSGRLSAFNSSVVNTSVEQDPWSTEGKIVQAYSMLLKAQKAERIFLQQSFQRVYIMEQKRIEVVQKLMHDFVDVYATQLTPLHQLALLIKVGPIKEMNAEQDLVHLQQAASDSNAAGESLSDRQEVAVELVKSEFFCSAEIIRQGRMDWLEKDKVWISCHFVLTRCGFLHWFSSIENVVPLNVINLSKSSFNDSDAQVITINEYLNQRVMGFRKQRKFTFRCPNYEETCEWAIALREAMIG